MKSKISNMENWGDGLNSKIKMAEERISKL